TNRITIKNIETSVSFGWDTKNDETRTASDVVKKAEDFMYQKKILSSGRKRNGIVISILNTLFIKFTREEAHSMRVSGLCEAIGRAYHLKGDEVHEMRILGQLHDIGKINIDESILNNENVLSNSEWTQIKQHPEIGYRLLGATSEFYTIADAVLAHHERWDGTGYPYGLVGEAIGWKARALAIADAYDAMVSERPYKASLSKEEAIAEIKKNAGAQFDPDIARVFVEKVLGCVW
ncbi:MAG: HD-GYP domain-containing protein, partial [Peptostreptococcaceae bacterium]|nr:HD-GYP domain-containing protein [Peptostreptococcaceae bacterium]